MRVISSLLLHIAYFAVDFFSFFFGLQNDPKGFVFSLYQKASVRFRHQSGFACLSDPPSLEPPVPGTPCPRKPPSLNPRPVPCQKSRCARRVGDGGHGVHPRDEVGSRLWVCLRGRTAQAQEAPPRLPPRGEGIPLFAAVGCTPSGETACVVTQQKNTNRIHGFVVKKDMSELMAPVVSPAPGWQRRREITASFVIMPLLGGCKSIQLFSFRRYRCILMPAIGKKRKSKKSTCLRPHHWRLLL